MGTILKNFFIKNRSVVVLTIVYLVIFLYMLPLRNLTYQDDWAYALSVKQFVQTGVFRVVDWSASALVFPVFLGAVFSAIFGFSIAILHLSVIIVLYFGLICFYLLLKKLKVDDLKSVFFTIILWSSPFVFQFSYSFQTDVIFMSLAIISMYFYVTALQKNSVKYYFLGSVFGAFSFLTRQIGIAIFLSVLVVFVYKYLLDKKILIKQYLLAIGPFIFFALIYLIWVTTGKNMTSIQYRVNYVFISTLPYLNPFNIQKLGGTYGDYLGFVQRIILYLHLVAGFLGVFFLAFKLKIKNIAPFTKKKFAFMFSIFFYLSFLAFEIFQHASRKTFIIEVPTLVTRNNVFLPIDFNIWWKYIVLFSLFFWIPLGTIVVDKLFFSFFKQKRKANFKLFIVLMFGQIVFILSYLYKVFEYDFRTLLPSLIRNDFFSKIQFYILSAGSSLGLEILSNMLIVLFVLISICTVLIVLLSFFQFRLRKLPYEYLFLFLSFLVIFSILIFYMYGYWHEYIISLLPFFVIGLALYTKKWKLNVVLAIFISTIILIFSATSTKTRYQDLGIQWEVANKLVSKGIKPADICYGDESWLAWWYYESSFKNVVDTKYGGDKYLLTPAEWSTWYTTGYVNKCRYSINSVDLHLDTSKNKKTVYDTGAVPVGLFSYRRYVATAP